MQILCFTERYNYIVSKFMSLLKYTFLHRGKRTDEAADRGWKPWWSRGFCVPLHKQNVSSMQIFVLFFMLGYGIVLGAFKILACIVKLGWLLATLLCRVVGELAGGVHC